MTSRIPFALVALTLISLPSLAAAQTSDLIGPYQLYEEAYRSGDFGAASAHARALLDAVEGQAERDPTE